MALPDYPITRNEQYLSRIAGEDHPIPDYPITREEQYLAAIAEGGGGGGGGLPPVTGSGKALVSVNGRWTQQEGFPYDEGETTETKFDETFTGFTRGTEETGHYVYPIANSDPDNENNVVIDGVTYYYVNSNAYDYTSIEECTVRAQDGNGDWPSGLELIQSGDVKKVAIPYFIEQYDPETGEPVGPLTGTLYGVAVPTDGAQDADGNTFPAAGFYASINGDLSGSYVGVESLYITYPYPSEYWTATVPMDSGVEFDSEKNYRVYIEGEAVEGAYADYTTIVFDNSYVDILEVYDEEGEEVIGYEAVCYLYAEDYESAPERIEIKVDDVVSGLHKLDDKYINGQTLPDASQLNNGTAMIAVDGEWKKQEGYAFSAVGDEFEPKFEGEFSDFSLIDDERWYSSGYRFSFDEFDYTAVHKVFINGEEKSNVNVVAGADGFSWDVFFYGGYIHGEGVSFSSISLYNEIYPDAPDSVRVRVEEATTSFSKFDPDYIPWDSMPSDAIPWYAAPEGTGLPEPTYEDGTYILQATESDGEMTYEWVQGGGSVVVNVTKDDDGNYIADKTVKEICEATQNQNVVCCLKGLEDDEEGIIFCHLQYTEVLPATEEEEAEYSVSFYNIDFIQDLMMAYKVFMSGGEDQMGAMVTYYEWQLTPNG